MRLVFLLISLGLCWPDSHGQDPELYMVFFDEKPAEVFDPFAYLDPRAIERRAAQGLPICDWYDLPLNESYVSSISGRVDSLRYSLRWFNAVSVAATSAQIKDIQKLPFVREVHPLGGPQTALAEGSTPLLADRNLDTLLSMQRDLMHLDTLLHMGLTGRGVRVAVFDAGFQEADVHPSLQPTFLANKVIATKNFYSPRASTVYHHSRHGTQVMSCIAGYYEDRQIGAAPDVEFLLARVEHKWWEFSREEDHWLAAAEWADRMGASLINASLTYVRDNYGYVGATGRMPLVSKAAKIATEKGMLVINSMGNDGLDRYPHIGAPAEVAEVLSVGGSLPMLREKIPFSTPGPNPDGLVKPDISAPGFVVGADKYERYSELAGTSFAAPMVTGVAACLLQQDPTLSPSELHSRLRQGGHYFPYYDYDLGYGVLDIGKLLEKSGNPDGVEYEVYFRSDSVILAFDSRAMVADSMAHPYGRMLYFHLAKEDGLVLSSQAVRIPNSAQYYYFRRRLKQKGYLRIWFEGTYREIWLEE